MRDLSLLAKHVNASVERQAYEKCPTFDRKSDPDPKELDKIRSSIRKDIWVQLMRDIPDLTTEEKPKLAQLINFH